MRTTILCSVLVLALVGTKTFAAGKVPAKTPEAKAAPAAVPAQAQVSHPAVTTPEPQDEPWKGNANPALLNFGAMTGLTWLKGKAAIPVQFTLGAKLLDQGFVPDLNNQVFLDFRVGPVLNLDAGDNAALASLGLRWMFYFSPTVAYYATGGLRFMYLNDQLKRSSSGWYDNFGSDIDFGVGVSKEFPNGIALRAEYAYRILGVGVSFGF